jgi:drug/metabolite transporter (DMT)-like permease
MPIATNLSRRRKGLSWIALAVVCVVWGTTYLAIRVGVQHLPPLFLAGTRFLLAGAVLYPIAVRMNRRRPPSEVTAKPGVKAWLACALVGLLLLVMGNAGITVGETVLPSGLTAVLVATVPLWMIVFDWPLQHHRVTVKAAIGLAVGLIGVVILIGGVTSTGEVLAVILALGASAAWGFGSVLSHRLPVPSFAPLAAAIEMLVAGVVLLAAAADTGEFAQVHFSSVPAQSWLALAYLIVFGSVVAFTAYGYALAHLPVTTVSVYAYINPVVAVIAGTLVLSERFTLREGLGTLFVVGSVMIILHRARRVPRSTSAIKAQTQQAEAPTAQEPSGAPPSRPAQPALSRK